MASPSIVEIPPHPSDLTDAYILRVGVAAIFIATPLACLHPTYRLIGEAWLLPLGLGAAWMYLANVMEIGLAAWLLVRRPGLLLSAFLIALVAFYTALLAWLAPPLLHHPLGILSKNLPILGASFAMAALYRPPLVETGRIALWAAFGGLWLYEGLVPKILFPSALEIGWIEQVGLSPVPPTTALLLIGLFEIALGLLNLAPGVPLRLRQLGVATQLALMLVLPLSVVAFNPEFLIHPFMPLGKNLPMIAVAVVLLRHTRRGLGPWTRPFAWRIPPDGPAPVSRLSPRGGRGGHTCFQREDLVDTQGHATGLLDSLDELRSPDFDPDAVHPDIRRFYEHTRDYAMTVHARWTGPLRLLAPLFRRLYARPVGQFALPIDGDPDTPLTSQILPLRSERDGRSKVRGWVRYQPELDLTIYCAAYSKLIAPQRPMMSVAFIQPFGTLTTVLQPDNIDGDAIRISTCGHDPYAGNYLALCRGQGGLVLKLPFMHEQLEVRTLPDGRMEAHHLMWMFGIPYIHLRYVMTPTNQPPDAS